MTYPKMINWSYYQGSLQDYIDWNRMEIYFFGLYRG